jgi:putative ABC transport system substrate-binding protein
MAGESFAVQRGSSSGLPGGLRELGWVEGDNVAIEYRWAEGKAERASHLAAELTRLKVNSIVTFGNMVARAAQQATTTIPIVVMSDDLLGEGLVASLARPGGNTTGVTIVGPELSAKRLELLKESVPTLSRVAVLWDPGTGPSQVKAIEVAGRSLAVQLQLLEIRRHEDVGGGLDAAKQGRAEAINVLASPLLHASRKAIIEFAAKERLPAIYQWRESAEDGGLMSYGPILLEIHRRTAYFVDRILKGTNPADLPVEQPTKFELAINLKTAKQIGLIIPPNVLARADKVIR